VIAKLHFFILRQIYLTNKNRSEILLDTQPESLFNFGSSRSLRGHFLRKIWVNFVWIDDSRILNRSGILKFENFSYPDPDSKILEQERSWCLKMLLRPLCDPRMNTSRFSPLFFQFAKE